MECESASHAIGHGFAPWLGVNKDFHKNDTDCLPAWHAGVRVRVWQCKLTVKGWVKCGTINICDQS